MSVCSCLSFIIALVAVATAEETDRRRVLSSSSCASGSYSGTTCSSSDPTDCPCTALSDDEKQQILDLHNDRRDLAASGNEDCSNSGGTGTTNCPAGTDMNALIWDESLEAIATYWAHQCDFSHHDNVNDGEQETMYKAFCDDDDCLAIGYNEEWIGENLGASASSNPNWDIDDVLNRITNWFDESVDYYWDTQTSHGTTGHWTQGVWAKTRYLGCGYAACDTGSPWGDSGSFSEWFYVVCKYFPGGNYNSAYPYTEGTKCSDCDADRSECEGDNGGLCGGDICLNCAADFFQNDCTYTDSTCPSTIYDGDGIGDTSSPTNTPTSPTTAATGTPTAAAPATPTTAAPATRTTAAPATPTTAAPATPTTPTTAAPTSPTTAPLTTMSPSEEAEFDIASDTSNTTAPSFDDQSGVYKFGLSQWTLAVVMAVMMTFC